jgi:hypothetical protein
MSSGERDLAKGLVATLLPTGLAFLFSGWVVGVVCLAFAGSISVVLWTPLGSWLGFDRPVQPSPPWDSSEAARVPSRSGRIRGGAAVGEAIRRSSSEREVDAVFLAVEAEVALAHEEALEMTSLLRADWPHITPTGAVVEAALPDWRAKTTTFVGTVLGAAQRAAFKGADKGANSLERLEAQSKFLNELALGLAPDLVRVGEGDLLRARAARRKHQATGFLDYNHERPSDAPPRNPDSIESEIDSLMREGIDLVEELSIPTQPERSEAGFSTIVGGDAPDDWWEKAEEFVKSARSLLTERQPALLKDFEEGFNGHIHQHREGPTRADGSSGNKQSMADTMLGLADAERGAPRQIVEASLEGLTHARRRLGN